MSTEKKDALTLTSQMLNECKSPAEIVDLPAVEKRWVDTYEMTTGKKDGDLKFHAEKIVFLQTIAENKQLAECTPMSIYSSFILLAVSGLSLRDGQSYLIPYKKKAVWMPGWKGRLEQISQIKGVEYLAEPICVYENEEFDFEVINGEYVINKHKPQLNTKDQDIVAVYAVMRMLNGSKRIFLMKREEVLSIRDRYSVSYKDYMSIKPNAQGKRMKSGKFGDYEVEAPMWVTDEAQAFKKTLVKRIYNTIAKEGGLNANAKYIDDQIQQIVGNEQASELSVEDLEDYMNSNQVEESDCEVIDSTDDDAPAPETPEEPAQTATVQEDDDIF